MGKNAGPKSDDPFAIVRSLAESYQGIKLARGVVGKTTYATIGLFGLWAIVLWRLSGNWALDAFLAGGGLVASGLYVWFVKKTQDFATKNPGLALLEGAEFVEYQKWDAQIKGYPPLKSIPVAGTTAIEDLSGHDDLTRATIPSR